MTAKKMAILLLLFIGAAFGNFISGKSFMVFSGFERLKKAFF